MSNDPTKKDPIVPTPTNPSGESKHSVLKSIEQKAKAAIKSDKTRDPMNQSEFLTKNTMRVIEKTYWFLGFLVVLFVIVAVARPEIIDKVMTIFGIVIGGILAFMTKDALRGNSTTNAT